MKRLPFHIWMLFFWLAAGAATAAEVTGLYEAEVAVADQQGEARQQAMGAGLAEVLVRATGYSSTPQDPALADLLANAPRYVQQYRYRTTPETAGQSAGLTLWMSFDAAALGQALRARGQPVWGSARPLLLVWLVLETGSERRLVSAAESAGVAGLESAARRRGVPLRLPLLDPEDQARITAADVWGGFQEPVLNASARYRPQAILLGRLYHDRQGQWHARWTLRLDDESMHWESVGATPDEVLAAGVDGSTDALAMRFAQVVDLDGGSVVTLRVSDVQTLSDYARLLNYLRALAGVTAVQVTEVEPRAVTCRLSLEANPAAVTRTIGLGSTLAAVGGVAATTDPLHTELHYRLLP